MCKKMTMFKKILCLKSIHEKNPFSLSKWSNYPSSFHKRSQNNIQEILSQKRICNFGKVFKYLWSFGHVQETFNVPEVSKKNQIVRGVWIFYGEFINTDFFWTQSCLYIQQWLNWFWPPKLELIISVIYKIYKFNLRKAYHFLTKVSEKHLQF